MQGRSKGINWAFTGTLEGFILADNVVLLSHHLNDVQHKDWTLHCKRMLFGGC